MNRSTNRAPNRVSMQRLLRCAAQRNACLVSSSPALNVSTATTQARIVIAGSSKRRLCPSDSNFRIYCRPLTARRRHAACFVKFRKTGLSPRQPSPASIVTTRTTSSFPCLYCPQEIQIQIQIQHRTGVADTWTPQLQRAIASRQRDLERVQSAIRDEFEAQQQVWSDTVPPAVARGGGRVVGYSGSARAAAHGLICESEQHHPARSTCTLRPTGRWRRCNVGFDFDVLRVWALHRGGRCGGICRIRRVV
jgi:hypothetical protein